MSGKVKWRHSLTLTVHYIGKEEKYPLPWNRMADDDRASSCRACRMLAARRFILSPQKLLTRLIWIKSVLYRRVADLTASEESRLRIFWKRKTRFPASEYPRSCNSHTRQLEMAESKRPPRSRELRQHEFQRVYKACIPCARRKVKCQLVDGSKCARCSKKRLDCTFSTKKPWSREPKNSRNVSSELSIRNESVQERFAACFPYSRSVCLHSSLGPKALRNKPRPNTADFQHQYCRKLSQATMTP